MFELLADRGNRGATSWQLHAFLQPTHLGEHQGCAQFGEPWRQWGKQKTSWIRKVHEANAWTNAWDSIETMQEKWVIYLKVVAFEGYPECDVFWRAFVLRDEISPRCAMTSQRGRESWTRSIDRPACSSSMNMLEMTVLSGDTLWYFNIAMNNCDL